VEVYPTSPAVAKAFGDSGVAVIDGNVGVNNLMKRRNSRS